MKNNQYVEMEGSKLRPVYWALRMLLVLCVISSSSAASELHPLVTTTAAEHRNYTAISEFRLVNRRYLLDCPDPNPYIRIETTPSFGLSDDQFVNVTVSGVMVPSATDWIAMISPSSSQTGFCPQSEGFYMQTGDLSSLPLLCHYPVKAEYLRSDPDYDSCMKSECRLRGKDGHCITKTCNGTLTFHVINIRTDIEFVFFANGFNVPCVLAKTGPIKFATPNKPLYGHLAAVDSTGTKMRLTWVSGDKEPQQVQYGNKTETSRVDTFTQRQMCDFTFLGQNLGSPAKDFGWHDPGFIHSAVMTGLEPSTNFTYKYGSDSVGWSDETEFRTPPAAGSDEVKFIAFGDMGKAPLDSSIEHYMQPGAISVVEALKDEVKNGKVDSIFHIGDISYATGFLVEWDFFLHLITLVASRVPYMTAIGNHERDYPDSGSTYSALDSGGECGVPYQTYFPMPTSARDKPWYSIEQASVHFTVISTEHDWSVNSEQYDWMQSDMASVNRSKTPWLIFAGHRPLYSSVDSGVDIQLANVLEPLLVANNVDLGLYGHVHNYERSCSVSQGKCRGMPTKDANGIQTYNHTNYIAPVHAVIGTAGFELSQFPNHTAEWSLIRISKYGYLRAHATKHQLQLEFVNSHTREVEDTFRIIK